MSLENNGAPPSRKEAIVRLLRPLALVFIVINSILLVFRAKLEGKGVDSSVVILGNLLLFLVSAVSVWMYSKANRQTKSHGIIRNVYGGFMLKFFTLIVAAMVYFYFAKEINKPAIFICMGIYLLYNFLGVSRVVKSEN